MNIGPLLRILMAIMIMMIARAAKAAAKAAANLPLSMVVPPQDVVDERFQKQCLITISVAGVIVRYLGFWI